MGTFSTKQKVIGLLRNPIYLGQIRWGDSVRDATGSGRARERRRQSVSGNLAGHRRVASLGHAEEQMQLLRQYIEVIELGDIASETHTGSYAMRLFP